MILQKMLRKKSWASLRKHDVNASRNPSVTDEKAGRGFTQINADASKPAEFIRENEKVFFGLNPLKRICGHRR
jgi:hypothetical protein